MKKQRFAILDKEKTYAKSLMNYLAGRQSLPLETIVFDSVESLVQYTKTHRIDLLLLSENMQDIRLSGLDIRETILLSEGELLENTGGYPSVYKYQSSENLVAEVMSCYARQASVQTWYIPQKTVELIGIYSPVGRCGKTSFALTLGQVLSRRKRVLYLNLEDYAGYFALQHKDAATDLSDVMYFLRQNRGNAVLKLSAALQKIGRIDYLPPAFSAADLSEIQLSEWQTLLEELMAKSMYGAIILDIGCGMREGISLLAQCRKIYLPYCRDPASEAKTEQFKLLLNQMEYEEIWEKTEKLLLPYCAGITNGEASLEQLEKGEMGAFVEELLGEGERTDGSETDGIWGAS